MNSMTDSVKTLNDALQEVSHPDVDAIVKGWKKVASKGLGLLSVEDWQRGRQLAQQREYSAPHRLLHVQRRFPRKREA